MQRSAPAVPKPTSTSAVGLRAVLVPQPGAWSAAGRTAHEVQLSSSNQHQQQPPPSAPLTPGCGPAAAPAAQHGTAADSVTIEINGLSTSSDGIVSPATSATPSVLTDVQEIHGQREQFQYAEESAGAGSLDLTEAMNARYTAATLLPQTPAGRTASTSSSTTGALTAATATTTTAAAATAAAKEKRPPSTATGAEAGAAATAVVSKHVDLLSEKTDVYACAVRGLLHCRRSTALHMWSAMIIICFVQMALLGLLLQAAQDGSTIQTSDRDLLKQQSSVMQLQLCQMHQAMVASNLTVLGTPLIDNYGRCECLIKAATTNSLRDNYNSTGMSLSDMQRAYANLSKLKAIPSIAAGADIFVANKMSIDQQLKVLLVMLLSMGALSVFVIREATQALQLAYAVAASARRLPIQFTSPEHRGNVVAAFAQRWRVVLAYPIPLFQMAVAVLAFCTMGSILSMPDFLNDITQFTINSVALAFVIEIDDKAGDVLAWALRFKHNRVLLDQQYRTSAVLGFNSCSIAKRQVPARETGVSRDWTSDWTSLLSTQDAATSGQVCMCHWRCRLLLFSSWLSITHTKFMITSWYPVNLLQRLSPVATTLSASSCCSSLVCC